MTEADDRPSTNPWVEVRNCAWLHEAQVFQSVLAGAGIETMIPDQHSVGIQPFYGFAIGGVRVLVRFDDLERAIEVLDVPGPEVSVE